MSENTLDELAQVAFAEYYGRQSGAALVMPDSWAMQSDASRDDWRAAAGAVAAHVANPTAGDFDHAAEIMRLRELAAEILADFWPGQRFEGISEGLRDSQARVDDYRKRAGLDPQ